MARESRSRVLMQGALKNEPELGALPNALDFIKNDADRKVMELHFTQKTAARPLVAPPEVPAERVAMLRKAFEALAKDKDFLAEMEKAKMEFDFVPGEEIDKVVGRSWRRRPTLPSAMPRRLRRSRSSGAQEIAIAVAKPPGNGCGPRPGMEPVGNLIPLRMTRTGKDV